MTGQPPPEPAPPAGSGPGRDPAGDPAPHPARELERELERVADRLRVVGPRVHARTDRGAALAAVREVLQALADLAADAESRPRRPVPELAAHALGDQLLVLGHDVLGCADPFALQQARDLVVALRRAL